VAVLEEGMLLREQGIQTPILVLGGILGNQVPGFLKHDLTLTRQDLAEMSGTTLYTVSRLLSSWEKQGLVIASRERVIICNPHGLARILEAEAY
jgi:CRP-like cAMP-binding protein